MNCLDFRRMRLSDPYTTDAHLLAHRSGCEACRGFEAEILNLDRKIAKALTVEVPEGLAAKILLNHSLQSRSRQPAPIFWLSMAASIFLAVGAFGFWWSARSPVELALVDHLEMEQLTVDSIRMTVHPPQIQQVLNSVDLDLADPIGNVVFASTCIINGELVAHLVIQEAQDEFTLLLIPSRIVEGSIEFSDRNWSGVISPHGSSRSLAVLSKGRHTSGYASMHSVLNRFSQSLIPVKA